MKNIIAVACALLLPLNLIPQIAFAAAGEAKPDDTEVMTSKKKVKYMRVVVKGETGPFYCEVDECKDPAVMQKNGGAQLFFNFDSDGDPTLSQYKLIYDPKTNSRSVIKTEANSLSTKFVKSDKPGMTAVQVFTAGTSGKPETYYTTAETKKDNPVLFKDDGKTPSGYLLKPHPDHPGAYHAVPAKPGQEDSASRTSSKATDPKKDALKETAKVDPETSLETQCELREQLPDPSRKEQVALNQLIATDKEGVGIKPDGPSVSAAKSAELDAKCAELKKQKALAETKTDDGKNTVGTSAPPPDPKSEVQATGGAASSAHTGLLDNWGSYAGAVGGGIILAVVAAAIVGGPIGLAAGAGAAVSFLGMALYNNRNEIGQAVSTGIMAIVDFFKGG